MIKTWQERIVTANPPYVDPEEINKAMLEEIDELRAAFANLHSDYDIIETDREELQAKLAESEKCLQDSIDCNLNKLLAMTDEQVTALTRLEGSNPEEVAALARKTMELAVANVKLATAEEKLAALESQEPFAHLCVILTDAGLTKFFTAPSDPRGFPVYLAAGAAPAPRMTGAAPTSQKPVAEVLLIGGEKVIDASMAFFDSVELGTKLYLAAGAAPANEWKEAVLDSLANHGMDAPLTDAPQQIVKKLTDMVATMARDPAINAPAAKVPEEPRIDINDLSGMIAAVIKEQTP